MTTIILALLCLAVIFFWWALVVHRKNDDVILLFLGWTIVAFSGVFLNNDWIVRFRHVVTFVMPCIILWLIFAKKLKFSMLTWMMTLLLFLMFISGLWSNYDNVLHLKFMGIFFPLLFMFAGSYIDNSDKLQRFFLALLPGAIILSLAMIFAPRIFDADGRLVINNTNPNSLGGTVCALLIIEICCAYILKRKSWWLFPLIAASIYIMILSGSRTSMIAFLGAAMVWGAHICRNDKRVRFWYMFFCVLALLIAMLLQINVDNSRAFIWDDISGRDDKWETFFQNNPIPWCGLGFMPSAGSVDLVWGSMLNIYLNVYVDLGYIGIVLGSLILILLLRTVIIMWRNNRQANFIVISCIMVGLLHGFCESMAMRGTSILCVIFMSAIGMSGNLIKSPENFVESIFDSGQKKQKKSTNIVDRRNTSHKDLK